MTQVHADNSGCVGRLAESLVNSGLTASQYHDARAPFRSAVVLFERGARA